MKTEIRDQSAFGGSEISNPTADLRPLTSIFYAQQLEDEWIANNLPLPEKGFYVDIGCAHPFTTSNTAFLRDRGWQGLAVDGNPIWTKDWVDIPEFCCSLISPLPAVRFFHDPDCPWRSRISEENGATQRITETIEELLERYHVGKIDFLSVDAEGHEFDILSGLDYELHQPGIIIAEYSTAGQDGVVNDERALPFLLSKGYQLAHQNPINMIFTRDGISKEGRKA